MLYEVITWERETKDLEDQLNYILKHSDSVLMNGQCNEEEELTNRDFFWDLED